MEYDGKEDGLQSYQLARQLQREQLLRERAWQAIGPRNEEEQRIAEGKCPKE